MNNVQMYLHVKKLNEKYCKNCRKFIRCLTLYGTFEKMVKHRTEMWFWVNAQPDLTVQREINQEERLYQKCFLEEI